VETSITDPKTPANQMTGSSVFTDAAEFHAIGLRPMEFRPGVIRRAMQRSAAPLANLHLTQPTGDVEAKLARIVMTGYRLLDPRRREDSIQRMMLGRIHPQLADEAARLAQAQANQGLLGQSLDGDSEVMAERGLLGSQVAVSGRHAHRYFLHDPVSESLRSHDLLIERPVQRAVRLTKRWVSRKYLAAGAVLSCAIVSFLAWRSNRNSEAPIESAPAPIQQASLAPSVAASLDAVEKIAKTLPAASDMTPVQPVANGANMKPSVIESAAQPAVPVSTPVNNTAAIATTPSTEVETNQEMDRSQREDLALEATIPVIVPSDQVELESAANDSPQSVATATLKRPIPAQGDLTNVMAEWEATQQGLLPSDWHSRGQRSVSFAENIDGTAPARTEDERLWVGLIAAIRFAVLQGDLRESEQRISQLTNRFDLDDFAVAIKVLEQLRINELTPVTAQVTCEWLEVWAGRAILDGRFKDADLFVSQFLECSKETDLKPANTRASELQKSIATAKRFEETVAKLDTAKLGGAETIEPSPSDHYAVGRYWALVRRDWTTALPHLISGSDARLAKVATSESLLDDSTKPEALVSVASDYLALAEKSSGWLRDSYIVHANDLLHRKTAEGSSTAKLELDRFHKQLTQDHEGLLAGAERLKRSVPLLGIPVSNIASTPSSETPPNAAEPMRENGLLGRILVDGIDLGVELTFEPGARMTQKAFEQIASRLNVDLKGATIRLAGVVTLEQPTAMFVHVANLGEKSGQLITIADKELATVFNDFPNREDELRYRIDLPPGRWTLRWTTPVIANRDLTFRVTDGLSDQPIPVKTWRPTDEMPGPPLPTRLRTTVITGQ
jgi:hypothetical protein